MGDVAALAPGLAIGRAFAYQAPMPAIPTKAFDDLVEEELSALAALLNQADKSIGIVVVAATGGIIETYCKTIVKPSERADVVQGLDNRVREIRETWDV